MLYNTAGIVEVITKDTQRMMVGGQVIFIFIFTM